MRALPSLRDASDFQPLYEAGLSRAIGDWLLGMNATRLYTMKYGAEPAGTFYRPCADADTGADCKPSVGNTEFCSQAILGAEDRLSRYHFLRHPPESEEELVLEAEKQKEAIAAGKKT